MPRAAAAESWLARAWRWQDGSGCRAAASGSDPFASRMLPLTPRPGFWQIHPLPMGVVVIVTVLGGLEKSD